MRLGGKVYFVVNQTLMKGTLYRVETDSYVIVKDTKKGKYRKVYKVKYNQIINKMEV